MSSRKEGKHGTLNLLLTPDEELDTGDYIRKLDLMDKVLGVMCWSSVAFLSVFGLFLIVSVAFAAKQVN